MKQVANFGQHTHRNHYRLAILFPPLYNSFVPCITGVHQRVERPGVGDYCHACGSRQSRSSTFADVFFFPLENLPVTDGSCGDAAGSVRYLAMASRTSDATLTFRRSAALLRFRRVFWSRNRLVRFMHIYYFDVCLHRKPLQRLPHRRFGGTKKRIDHFHVFDRALERNGHTSNASNRLGKTIRL